MAAPTPESNLASQQAVYQLLLVKQSEALASIGPSITVDGVTIDRIGYLEKLSALIANMAKIPGVAQLPVFNVNGLVR